MAADAKKPGGGSQKREHFRLEFPLYQRPKLRVALRDYEVLEISELGVKAVANGTIMPPLTQTFDATIVFTDGTKCVVTGKVIRRDGELFVMLLTAGIPLQKMYEEHRRLIQKHVS